MKTVIKKMNMTGVVTTAGMFLCTAGSGMGCAHSQATTQTQVAETPFRIGREDVLDISVWRDNDLSRVVPVRPDGFISLPMAGEIQAEGKTPTELEDVIKERLSPYVQAPKVTVIVHEVNSSKVFVTGEVQHPGVYPLRGRVSVLQALALAGGLSEFANRNGIVVIRKSGKAGRIPVSYGDLIHGDDSEKSDVALLPGDTVVVP